MSRQCLSLLFNRKNTFIIKVERFQRESYDKKGKK